MNSSLERKICILFSLQNLLPLTTVLLMVVLGELVDKKQEGSQVLGRPGLSFQCTAEVEVWSVDECA